MEVKEIPSTIPPHVQRRFDALLAALRGRWEAEQATVPDEDAALYDDAYWEDLPRESEPPAAPTKI